MYEIKEQDGSITFTGERLKFYYLEHKEFGDAYNKEITQERATKIIKKICRHYKIPLPRISFNKINHGSANIGWWRMELPKEPEFGIICHELAHFYQYQKFRQHHHTKKMMRILRRFVNYCRKKNYWDNKNPII